MTQDALPRLDGGLTHLQSPGPRSTALHRLVVNELRERDGPVYWLDARNVAATYALYELAPHHRLLNDVRVARAFTAYQHHSLAREIVRSTTPRTAMIVAPNLGSLYEDDDVPDYEQDDLFAAAATLLGEVGRTHDLPVLVTTDASGNALPPAVADGTTRLTCEQTRMGLRYAADEFETTVYVEDGYWQTTIPYWVDLFGAVQESERSVHPAPTEPDLGPLEIAASSR